MAMIGLSEIRFLLDDAITYGDLPAAKGLVEKGLCIAQERQWIAEEMYFKAQREIIEENDRDAILYLDLAIKHNPCDGAAYNDRALCMIELGMTQEAFSYFDQGIACEPDYANVYHNKGWLLNKLGQHAQAVSFLKKALEPSLKRIQLAHVVPAY